MSEPGIARGPETRDPLVEQTGFRLSWGAIVAGMLVATALHVVMALLGVAIGLDTWEPGERLDTLGGVLGIWVVVSGVVALFVGGLTTGRLAGILTRGDGALHGMVLWSLSTLLAAWLVASGLTTVVGGAFGLVGRTTAAAAGGLTSTLGQAGSAALSGITGMDMAEVQGEVERLLEQTGDPALRPDTLAADIEAVGERATGPANNQDVAREIIATITERGGEVDREAVINVITARTDMSRPEAERVATRVETLVQNAMAQVSTAADTIGRRAEDLAGDASEAVAAASWWALLALGLSFGAAVGGTVIKARE
ncbi:MAG TPA: hypothetical protein VK912_01575 [Longimicrobiales bacterium]|nr:hypothetical protein [Longimicrobiales bacterium]